MKDSTFSRRQVLSYSAAIGAATLVPSQLFAQSSNLIKKTIPSSGEQITPIGIGTNRYGAGTDPTEYAALVATLKKFTELGGSLIDTAPGYGDSEMVIGRLVSELKNRDKLFLATKTDMRGQLKGKASFMQSNKNLQVDKVELMQVHNLLNAKEELAIMREWHQEGKVKYIGVTTSQERQFGELENLMKQEKMDFVQLNYSLDDRKAAEKLLPLAQEKGIAVLINLPFGRARLFESVEGMDIPDWAREYDINSWGQFFLKYIISHPAITAAIPGTRKEHHAIDNMGAAMGKLPDAAFRKKQEQFFDDLG